MGGDSPEIKRRIAKGKGSVPYIFDIHMPYNDTGFLLYITYQCKTSSTDVDVVELLDELVLRRTALPSLFSEDLGRHTSNAKVNQRAIPPEMR